MCSRTHLVQRLRGQLGRLEQLRHFAGRQLPRGVSLAQVVQTRVIPLLVFTQGDEARHAGFLLHTRWEEREAGEGGVLLLLGMQGPPGDALRPHGPVHGARGFQSEVEISPPRAGAVCQGW